MSSITEQSPINHSNNNKILKNSDDIIGGGRHHHQTNRINGENLSSNGTNNTNNQSIFTSSSSPTPAKSTLSSAATAAPLLHTALLPIQQPNGNLNQNSIHSSIISTNTTTNTTPTVSSGGRKIRNSHKNNSTLNDSITINNNTNNISDNHIQQHNGNFLPIAPHQQAASYFQHQTPQHHHPHNPHQGITLASVHQQLQPGSVAVFTSPAMAMTATLAGAAGPQATATVHQQQGASPGQTTLQHAQQSLVVNSPMAQQFPAGTFQTANGQIIQTAPGMQMFGSLPTQVQVIGPNGQQAYIPQFYTTGQMQSPFLLNNLSMTIPAQNANQGLAIQLPTTPTNAGTMITTTGQIAHQTANQQQTVKGQSNQTIMKGVTISPQHHNSVSTAATNKNNSANNMAKNQHHLQQQQQHQQQQHHAQQQVLQSATAFQSNTTNQTFVITGIAPQQQAQNGQTTTTILQPTATQQSTVTNARKTTGSGRSNNKATSLIQKIQPTSPLLAQTQFKPNTSFATAANTNSPTAGQTIMVHGQSIQTGPNGNIQLTSNQPTILPLTSFQTLQPSITWTASPQLNPQPTQLVGPNGQILIRTQGPNDSHMLIQTSNNQFQAVPMQVTPTTGDQQQNQQNTTPMQVTPTGQPTMIATSSINPSMPISIQTNQGVATMSTPTIVNSQQQANSLTNTMLTMVSSSSSGSSTPTTSTSVAQQSRQRPLRPAALNAAAGSTVQSTNATQTSTPKSRSNANNNIPKLAPKGSNTANASLSSTTSSSGSSSPTTFVSNQSKAQTSISTNNNNSGAKISMPIVLPKAADNITNASIVNNVNQCNNVKTSISKSISSQSVQSATPIIANTNSNTSTVSSSTSNMPISIVTTSSQQNNLVTGASTLNNNNNTNNNKINRNKSQTEKKDAASGTENNKSSSTSTVSSSTSTPSTNANMKSQMKTNTNSIRNNNSSTNVKSKIPLALSSTPPNTLVNNINANNSSSKTSNQTINGGTQTPTTTPSLNKTLTMNGGLTNGVLAKSNTTNTITNNNQGSQINKTKQIDSNNQVLTHVIDGYVIQESANPFPINGFLTSSEFDPQKTNDVEKMEVDNNTNDKNDDKDSSDKQKETENISPSSQITNQQNGDYLQINDSNGQILGDLCVNCNKNKRLIQAKKKKWKRYCQTCIDKFLQKQQQKQQHQQQQQQGFVGNNSSTIKTSTSFITHQPPTAAAIATAVVGSTKMNGSIATSTNISSSLLTTATLVNGLNGVKHSSTIGVSTPSTTTTNGLDIGQNMAKRPLNQQSSSNIINNDQQQTNKRLRLSSPTNGNPTQTNGDVVNNNNNVNAITTKIEQITNSATNVTTTATNKTDEDDRMWLPANGTKEPSKWTVQEVYEFVRHCGDGCSDLADGFRTQEIDGQALMLIKEDHIIDILNTKLGPALKICRKIKELKERFNC